MQYSLIKPLNWGERESKQQRTKNVVNAYIGQLMSPYQVDWNILGNVYRPEQRRPDLSVKRLFKNKMMRNMKGKKKNIRSRDKKRKFRNDRKKSKREFWK